MTQNHHQTTANNHETTTNNPQTDIDYRTPFLNLSNEYAVIGSLHTTHRHSRI